MSSPPSVLRSIAAKQPLTQYSEGVRDVLVNGQVTIDQGAHTGVRAGRVLRGPGGR